VASSAAFDPARPLWEITLVEGLPERRAALVVKVHHALTDGVGGIQLAAHVVDAEREPAHLGPMPAVPTGSPQGSLDGLADAVAFGLGRAARIGTSLASGLPGSLLRTARHPVRTVGAAAATTASIARLVQPVTTTASPLMTERSLRRHFARL